MIQSPASASKSMVDTARIVLAGACLLSLLGAKSASAAGDIQPGTVLGPSTADQAQGLMPQEFLDRYQKGEWSHEVVEPKPGVLLANPEWVAAGKENTGRFTVNEEGTIVDVKTGEQPRFIWGPPFPDIGPADPKAALKLMWNYFYSYWSAVANSRNVVALTWLSREGIDREASNEVFQKFWDGMKPHQIPSENPQNILTQQFVTTTSPADLQGINALTWRYRDTRRDSTWSYVPALRRVRQVTPANRADGFLGSDMSQDDGGYFDAKPEDFDWKLIGEGEQLFSYDRAAVVEGAENLQPLPGGGWRAVTPDENRFNYQKDDFDPEKELSWAPVSDRYVLVKRPVWIVEGTPKDKYYPYGKIVLRLDKGDFTGSGSYASKYDWKDNLINSYFPGAHGTFHKKGEDYRPYSAASFTMAQNFKLDRATVSRAWKDDASVPSDSLVVFDDRQFEIDSLARSGK